MNGNTVLVSRAVVRRVGNLDPAFAQQMGDFDYGLRARAAGCSVWTTPGTIGMCASHPRRRTDQQPLTVGVASSLVDQGALTATVGDLHPSLGGQALAAVLAESLCPPWEPDCSWSARPRAA